MFMSRGERRPSINKGELDRQVRAELVEAADDRMLEAMSTELLDDVDVFGHHVAVIRLVRDTGESVRLYRPNQEARTAGYVPDLWVEFGGNNLQDGCFLEVWPNKDRLVRPVETEDGTVPEPLPVSGTRVMVARARNIVVDGVLQTPFLVSQ